MQVGVLNTISVDACAVNFAIVAMILYRSTKVSTHRQRTLEAGNMTLKQYLDSYWTNTLPNSERALSTGQASEIN